MPQMPPQSSSNKMQTRTMLVNLIKLLKAPVKMKGHRRRAMVVAPHHLSEHGSGTSQSHMLPVVVVMRMQVQFQASGGWGS
jgi:hypothetical protein